MDKKYAALERLIGVRTVAEDCVTAMQIHRLNVTLNRSDPLPKDGDPVPWGWHAIFFPGLMQTEGLLSDGTACELDETSDNPLPRRMYAGNQYRFHEPLRVGDRATKELFIKSVQPKHGSSGELVFVTYGMRISGPRGLVLEDDQKLVFRDKDRTGGKFSPVAGEPASKEASWHRTISLDPVTLFRFSACCFNPHRIHYDYPYVTEVENYPGLVVQGPLTAVLLLELLRENVPEKASAMTGFTMRARAPLFANRPITLLGEPAGDGSSCKLWAANEAGQLAMEISATFRLSGGGA